MANVIFAQEALVKGFREDIKKAIHDNEVQDKEEFVIIQNFALVGRMDGDTIVIDQILSNVL